MATAFAPLGSNLLWVAHFDNATRQWSVYDPNGFFSPDLLLLAPGMSTPTPAEIGALTHSVSGKLYWVKVSQEQTVTLQGATRTLYAEGLNPVSW